MAINKGIPVPVAFDWWSAFDFPKLKDGVYQIGIEGENLGFIRGGHASICFRAYDSLGGLWLKPWADFPEVLMPYATFDRLMKDGGEAAIIVNRLTQ